MSRLKYQTTLANSADLDQTTVHYMPSSSRCELIKEDTLLGIQSKFLNLTFTEGFWINSISAKRNVLILQKNTLEL